jgi:hypothetical protein
MTGDGFYEAVVAMPDGTSIEVSSYAEVGNTIVVEE